ncbi:MFS transporter [Roseobacter sp. GAI101]|uniref:MFS transporter n=1 Tax=Roseobacter sp. (strain GAI101) TaxID=391589 RepID=UPI000187211C|nr:MFS transporter [Roseobacter sp. GAI101]EEB85973.1 major facilitator superfamily protein [Roseobacter sp. GAI101]
MTDRAPSRPGAVLALILTAYLMIALDLSIIFTGLPEIGETMGLDPVALSWVHNTYLLSFGGILLLAARLGDLVGRRRMLRTGIAFFTVASVWRSHP